MTMMAAPQAIPRRMAASSISLSRRRPSATSGSTPRITCGKPATPGVAPRDCGKPAITTAVTAVPFAAAR
jgi:hypothetical protein